MPKQVVMRMAYHNARSAAEYIIRNSADPNSHAVQETVDEVWRDGLDATNSAMFRAISEVIFEENGKPTSTEEMRSRIERRAFTYIENEPLRTLNGVDFDMEEQLVADFRDHDEDTLFHKMMDDHSLSSWLELWDETADLHWGRPGECGRGCPAYLLREFRFGDLTEAEMLVLRQYQEHGSVTAEAGRRLEQLEDLQLGGVIP